MTNRARLVLVALAAFPGIASAAPTPKPAKSMSLREVIAIARACAPNAADARSFELVHVTQAAGSTWTVVFPEARRTKPLTIDAVTGTCNGTPVTRTPSKPPPSQPDVDLAASIAAGARCVAAEMRAQPGVKIVAANPMFIVDTDFVWLRYRNDPPNGLVGPPELELGVADKACHWIPGE